MSIKIYNNDCLDEIPNIKEKVDMVLVDLPYGQTACSWDSIIDLTKMWVELKKVCKRDCVYVFFCNTKFGYKLIQSNEKWFRYDLVWEKSRKVGFLSANKQPLRNHEMLYVFSDTNSDDLDNNRNLGLREYFKKIMSYTGKTLKEITKQCGRCAEHCFYINSTQFGLPTEKTYNKLIDAYGIDKMDGFIDFKDLKMEKSNVTYNPQKTKGKPYKVSGYEIKKNIYGQEGVPTHENKSGDRHPSSILNIPEEEPREHEMLYVFKEKQGVYNPQKTEGKPYKVKGKDDKRTACYKNNNIPEHINEGVRHPTTIVKFNNPVKSLHRTQKPTDLCEWLVKSYSNEGDTVLDFTMGSGSSGVACINTQRNFIGIEKDRGIFLTARNRMIQSELDKVESLR